MGMAHERTDEVLDDEGDVLFRGRPGDRAQQV